MRPWSIAIALLVLAAGRSGADGIHLSWDDCGLAGSSFKTFACNTNEGSDALVISVQLPDSVDGVYFAGANLNVTTGVSLPDWWQIGQPAAVLCRDTVAFRVAHEPGSTVCPPLFPHVDVIGSAASTSLPGSNLVLINCGLGSDTTKTLVTPGTEYHLATLRLMHLRTVGDPACSGCLEPACIVLDHVDAVIGDEMPKSVIMITNTLNRREVTWQSDAIPNCPFAPVPAQRSTWGRIRALYR
jgi:hypothetical protein